MLRDNETMQMSQSPNGLSMVTFFAYNFILIFLGGEVLDYLQFLIKLSRR